jgi:small subunit ribosomal protein S19e
MASVYDVDPSELINKAAEELKKNENIKQPSWAGFVKTGVHRERAPLRLDWWYVRVAAVLRTLYTSSPIGVSKLRIKYGGRKRRGYRPPHFYKGSGNILRKVLQQLEKAGFAKKEEKAEHRGRVITKEGKSFLDKLATQIYKLSPKEPIIIEKKEEPKAEIKKEAQPQAPKPAKEKKPKVQQEQPK